ncbi:MAG: excinuclease ABC subunit UvrA [Gammaproteobacteria bacterium]|nr:excinuclease ABC subunit UvrA [Gammaproteobacteria bacterium]
MKAIEIYGARTHNLKNIRVSIPRDSLTVITGLSGSGKSSLAFDTLFAEGQRRYVESLSAYARQFLSMMEKPDIDRIEGLSPSISIDQKSTSHNPRSTVGTVTEIYDYLRLLYARAGTPYCPEHHLPLNAETLSQMSDAILKDYSEDKIMVLAPLVRNRKGGHSEVIENLRKQGFLRARIDGETRELAEPITLKQGESHTVEVIVDRLRVRLEERQRLAESLELAGRLSDGLVTITPFDDNTREREKIFSAKFACSECGFSIPELEPRIFSFNHPAGACKTCDGLGNQPFFDPKKIVLFPAYSLAQGALYRFNKNNPFYFEVLIRLAREHSFSLNTPFKKLSSSIQTLLFNEIIPTLQKIYHQTHSTTEKEELGRFLSVEKCPACKGERLNKAARSVVVGEKTLPNLTALSIDKIYEVIQALPLLGRKKEIAEKIIREVKARLKFLLEVGLDYLTLHRSADTLSGGEAQRIRLASQIGSGLVGVTYILDEPSIGLHPRDNERLLTTLKHLKGLGNTVVVIEHDEEAILSADHVIDLGPGAGVHGGTVVAAGSPQAILTAPHSLTGQYLSGARKIPIPEKRKPFPKKSMIHLTGASKNNLKNIEVTFPLGLLTCVTGVSGSGKSTLVNETLYHIVAEKLNGVAFRQQSASCRIKGLEHLDKVIEVDQRPIGRTPRSNSATYTGLLTPIRELFASVPEARSRGYKLGRFSFNVKGGRCEACQGEGWVKVEMHFLPDMEVPCDVCHGKRYNRETLDIRYKGKNIHEVLSMTIEEAKDFFNALPAIQRKLHTLTEVGLSYLQLGQSATTLSGGEAERVKLAKELSRVATGRTLYILDEPTTGLHFHDIALLLSVLMKLRDQGNTIIVIEHNLAVIKTADWIIDLGPEGGDKGGFVMATGTPEQIAEYSSSYTGQFLKRGIMAEQ